MKQIKVAVLGCGNRGMAYTKLMVNRKEEFQVVCICDPFADQMTRFQQACQLTDVQTFSDPEEFFQERRADLLIIATPDREHVPQGIRAMEMGYDILMEKPISDSAEECKQLLEIQKRTGRQAMVCHVLRYAPAFRKCSELLDSGIIGRLYAIDASERVSYWHWSQAYVRGIAGTLDEAHPTILAKCCHDLDLIQHYAGSRCDTLTSVGGLTFFTEENAPADATDRCVDCPRIDTCPYSAKRIYVDAWHKAGEPAYAWPYTRAANVNPITEKALYEGLRTGPFGRCAFRCGATNADHQMVQMTFENGVKASMKMVFGYVTGRRYCFYGTHGEIVMDARDGTIIVAPYGGEKEVISIRDLIQGNRGHGGGDAGLVNDLYDMLVGNKAPATSLEESLESHLIGIASVKSRDAGGVLVKVHE